MKAALIAILSLGLLLPSCSKPQQPDTAGELALVEASRRELVTALEERDRLLKLVREISQSVDEIKRLEQLKAVTDANPGDNAARRARLVAEIRAVRQTLRSRREQLQALEANLQKSDLFTQELQETINVLRRQIDTQARSIESLQAKLSEANQAIGTLSDTVDSLNVTVETVSGERDIARAANQTLQTELNTCYYVVAPKSDLREHHIVETAFLRKTKILKGDFDRGFFTSADKRTLTNLPLGSRKGQMLTNHPASSYEFRTLADGTLSLIITDPALFWSTTYFLVIQAD